MSCEDFRPFVGAYIDDEFDEREAAEFEAHVESCAECREELEEQLRMKRVLQQQFENVDAPEELKEEILAGMSEIDAECDARGSTGRRSRAAAALAAVVPLALGVVAAVWFTNNMTVAPAESGQLPEIEQTVEWHKNALPLEVTGPERKRVANWFRGKVNFPIRFPEFRGNNVELEGGRIAHVRDRRAAYLSYEVNGARMSTMMFHGKGLKIPAEHVREIGGRKMAVFETDGFSVAMLQDHGVTYTMTSSLPERELLQIVGAALKSDSAP